VGEWEGQGCIRGGRKGGVGERRGLKESRQIRGWCDRWKEGYRCGGRERTREEEVVAQVGRTRE
jgi:hypothetical protein